MKPSERIKDQLMEQELKGMEAAEKELDECHQWLNEYGIGGKGEPLLRRISLMADMAHEKLESEVSLWKLNAENADADRYRLIQILNRFGLSDKVRPQEDGPKDNPPDSGGWRAVAPKQRT